MKVADASLAVKWVIPEADSDTAITLLSEWVTRGERVVAPHLLSVEITNILLQKIRRQHLALSDAKTALERYLALPITIHPGEERGARQLHRDALEIAMRFGLPATYDAHYLALATSLHCELWTADQRLLNVLAGRITDVRGLYEADRT